MHTYQKSEPGLWTVGYWLHDDPTYPARFHPLKDFGTEAGAAAYVSYLNGGAYQKPQLG